MLTIVRKQSGQIESRLVRGFLLLCAAQSILAAFVGPILLFSKHTLAAGTIYYLMDLGAVRKSGETFYLLGFPLALNARWLGVFVGMLCGLLIYNSVARSFAKISPNKLSRLRQAGYWVGFLIVIPFAIDCFLGYLDRVLSTGFVFLIGYWFGLTVPFYLVPAVSSCLVVIRKSTHRFFATSHRLRS